MKRPALNKRLAPFRAGRIFFAKKSNRIDKKQKERLTKRKIRCIIELLRLVRDLEGTEQRSICFVATDARPKRIAKSAARSAGGGYFLPIRRM